MEDLLVKFGEYCNDNNIFTFGAITSEAFIDKLPTSKEGIGIVLTEMTQFPQELAYGGRAVGYETRAIDIYVITPSNDIVGGREKIYKIYNALLEQNTLDEDKDIISVVPSSPTNVGEYADQKYSYHMRITCKLRR